VKESSSELKIEKMKMSFDRHRSEAHVSIDQYVRSCSVDLGQEVKKRAAVYLDQRYWIIIRDVTLNRRTDTASLTLANLLKDLVRTGKVFCPISESVFVELLKQEDLNTRRSTAGVIDELSLGVTLIPESKRVGTELAHLLKSHSNPDSVYPLSWLVWSKLSYVLNVVHPTNTPFSTEDELLIQKVFFDHMWDISLGEVVDRLDERPVPPINLDPVAKRLNEENLALSNEVRSYRQAYLGEIAGLLSLYVETAREILESTYAQDFGVDPSVTDAERRNHNRELLSFFVQMFCKSEFAKQLPTIHIHASCHAAIRWDKKRRLKGNDLYDFHHAAAALAYCDLFLTERPLQILLSLKHLALDRMFGCKVISDVSEAVNYLRKMSSTTWMPTHSKVSGILK